jgi:Vps52 / Sac2 family
MEFDKGKSALTKVNQESLILQQQSNLLNIKLKNRQVHPSKKASEKSIGYIVDGIVISPDLIKYPS